jgi:hypothetical protein
MRRFLVPALLLNAVLLGVRAWQDFSHEATAQVAEVILDNGQAGTSFTGTWTKSSGPNPYGGTSLYNSVVGNEYRWLVQVPSDGFYDVYIWWTQMASRAPTATYVVNHAGGTSTFQRDQRTGGGQWNLLGSFDISTFGRVTVRTTAGFSTSADAVRFVSRQPPAPPAPPAPQLTTEQAEILSHMSIVQEPVNTAGDVTAKTLRISGVNVQIVSGLGSTDGRSGFMHYETGSVPVAFGTNGLGNLIIGYNEGMQPSGDDVLQRRRRTGSHNLVIGTANDYIGVGGLAVGRFNSLKDLCGVAFGEGHEVWGQFSAVTGGLFNLTSGTYAAVSGGMNRWAEGLTDWRAGELFQEE